MSASPSWDVEGVGWPHRDASRLATAGGLRWHVQSFGAGPTVLLLHGAGAATHSWRGLAPLLAERLRVIAPDLPGHGFTDTPGGGGLSLPEMARRLAALLAVLEARPALIVGHSAGAAIALRLLLDGAVEPHAVVAVNGALQPFPGLTAPLFQGMARLLFANPLAAYAFAAQARDPARVARLIARTGSTLDAEGVGLYARLFRSPGHIAGTLGMMANWDLETLRRDFERVRTPLTLIVGAADAAVPPTVAAQVRASIPRAEIVTLETVGHLAHEERPDRVAEIILRVARDTGVLERETA